GDLVERKLVGDSRFFPRERIAGYAASLLPIPPNLYLERQNVHGRQLRVCDPGKLAGKRVLVITGTADLDHSREADRAIVEWLNGNRRRAHFRLPGCPGFWRNRQSADAGGERRRDRGTHPRWAGGAPPRRVPAADDERRRPRWKRSCSGRRARGGDDRAPAARIG